MEDVRPVLVDQRAVLVITVIGVAADMVAAIDQENRLVALVGKALSEHAAGETGTDNQPIVHRLHSAGVVA